MELVTEATSDLTSACTECQSYVCSCWDPQTDLVSDLTAEGCVWPLRGELILDLNLRLRVWSLLAKTSYLFPTSGQPSAWHLCAGSKVLSWSQNSFWMTSALKNLTVIPEQLWQIILPPSSNALHLMPLFAWHVRVCVCVCKCMCVSVFEDTVISESECVHILVCLHMCMSVSLSVIQWEMTNEMIKEQKTNLFCFLLCLFLK